MRYLRWAQEEHLKLIPLAEEYAAYSGGIDYDIGRLARAGERLTSQTARITRTTSGVSQDRLPSNLLMLLIGLGLLFWWGKRA